MNAIGPAEAVVGIIVVVVAILLVLALGFFLVVLPVLLWLNVRRLRVRVEADLAALRASVERLSCAAPEAVPNDPPAEEGAPAVEAPPVLPPAVEEEIGFSCPECGKFFEAHASLAGSNYKCPECGVSFHIH